MPTREPNILQLARAGRRVDEVVEEVRGPGVNASSKKIWDRKSMNLLVETQLKKKLDTSQQRYLITKATILTSRVGFLVFSIIVGILVPIYLVLFACTIFVLRWYYAERFGIKYP